MDKQEELKQAFLHFTGKSLDGLTPKEEDFLLESWREEELFRCGRD